MGSLQDRLDRIRAGFTAKAPGEVKAVMQRATDDLRKSGILDGLPKVGDPLPELRLRDTEGRSVKSAELLGRGPLVLSFYRGVW